MRTIKFRLWSDSLKVMYSPDNQIANLWSIPEADNGIIKVDKGDVLMQFTGLLDKNGKEIYEGDIIRGINEIYGRNCKALTDTIVSFFDGAFGITIMYDSWFIPFSEMLRSDEPEQWIVIGTIYENPELL